MEAPPALLLSPVQPPVQQQPPEMPLSEVSASSSSTGTSDSVHGNDNDDDDAAALLALRNTTTTNNTNKPLVVLEPGVPIPAAVVVDAVDQDVTVVAAPEAKSSNSSSQSLVDSSDRREGPLSSSSSSSPMEEDSPSSAIVDHNNNTSNNHDNDNSLSSISTTNRSVDDSLLSTPPSSRRSSMVMIGPQQQQQRQQPQDESRDTSNNNNNDNRYSNQPNNSNHNNYNNNNHYNQYPGTENEARVELDLILSQMEGWKDCCHHYHYHQDNSSAAADASSSSSTNHDDYEMVIDSLVRFPGLITQVFADADGNGYYPLVHLMFAGANRNVLFEIAKQWPPVLLMRQGKDQSLPLHIACSRLECADEVIYNLTNWNSEALHQYNGTGLLPIHCALIKHLFFQGPPSTFTTIKYLLDVNPSTVLMQTSTGGYSCLDLAVHGGFDVFVLDYIAQTQQQQLALLQPTRPQKKHPYHYHPQQQSDKEEFQPPEPLATFVVPNDFLRQPICIDLDKALVLERILHKHQVQHLECLPMLWENREALQYFIKCLQNNPPATTRLHLRFPPSLLNSVCRFTFQQALEDNTILRRLVLICADEDSFKDSTDFIQSLRVGLEQNDTLNTLALRQFKGNLLDLCLKSRVSKTTTTTTTTTTHLPTKASALRNLELAQAEFTDNPEDYVLPPVPPMATSPYASIINNSNISQIQSLRICSCTISSPCLQLLLEGLARLPSLQELLLEVLGPDVQKPGTVIEQDPAASTTLAAATDTTMTVVENKTNQAEPRQPYDMTAPLVAIVAKGKLRKLSIGCYPLVQVAPFCEELKTNTSLTSLQAPYMFAGKETKLLNVLALHNTHLRQVQTHAMNAQSRAINEKINHFTMLNFCGRGRTRDDSLTRSEFVDLLCGVALYVNNAIANGGATAAATESFLQQKHSLLFGLLRESPNQWSLESDGTPCISPNSRKRRRQDHDAAVAA